MPSHTIQREYLIWLWVRYKAIGTVWNGKYNPFLQTRFSYRALPFISFRIITVKVRYILICLFHANCLTKILNSFPLNNFCFDHPKYWQFRNPFSHMIQCWERVPVSSIKLESSLFSDASGRHILSWRFIMRRKDGILRVHLSWLTNCRNISVD